MPAPRNRVESMLGMRMPRRPMPAARRPEPARAPTPSPAPVRRAERVEPEAPPAKRKPEAKNTVRAIVVDPAARTVKEVKLATEPGNEQNGFGRQIAEGEAEKIVDAGDLEALDLASGEVAIVDPLRQSETQETWTLGDGEPIAGPGVIVSYDPEADEYADAALTLDEAKKAVTWGDEAEGDADKLRDAIAARLEGMDAAQLQKLRAMLDEIEGAEPDEEDAEIGSSSYRDNRY